MKSQMTEIQPLQPAEVRAYELGLRYQQAQCQLHELAFDLGHGIEGPIQLGVERVRFAEWYVVLSNSF